MIIDCFTFFNELDLLEGRLEYLYDTVDYFVIVETNLTHSGKPKQLNYLENIDRYKKYNNKILYFPFAAPSIKEDFNYKPEQTDYNSAHWKLENYQRNYITEALKLFPKDSVVIISDLDEIPNKEVLKQISKIDGALMLDQLMFYYNFNQHQPYYWNASVITNVETAICKTPQQLRNDAIAGKLERINNGGWHLSYWGNPEHIALKIKSFAHQEFNKEEYVNLQKIRDRINQGRDPFDRVDMVKTNMSALPKDVLDIFKKYEVKLGMDHYWQSVEGFFNEGDAEFYKAIVKNAKEKAHFVEIGSYKGKSSSLMAVEIANSGKEIRFDCVDTWEGSEEHQEGQNFEDKDVVDGTLFAAFTRNMRPVVGLYTPIRMTSLQAAEHYANESLDFVFIDAAHDYDSVKADVMAWIPKLKIGGILSGHDYPHPPIKRLINELFGDLPSIGDCWYCERTS